MAQLLRFIRLIRTVAKSIAGGVFRNTSAPILTRESIRGATGPVAKMGTQLVRHVQTMRKAVTEPGVLHQTEQGVVTFDHILFHFAIIAKGWILIRPVVTIGCTIAHQVCIHAPDT